MHIRRPIVLFGDSITQFGFGGGGVGDEEGAVQPTIGWVSLMSSTYQRRADVLNRGYSGYNTKHAIELIPQLFSHPSTTTTSISSTTSLPLFCTVWFGANDASILGERQHIPLQEYENNLTTIITSIRHQFELTLGGTSTGTTTHDGEDDDGITDNIASSSSSLSLALPPIIVLTPPPIDEGRWKDALGLFDYYDRTNANTREYGLVAIGVAEKLGCPYLDTWELLNGGSNTVQDYGQHLCDGLHLSDSGNQLIYQGLMDLIKKQLPQLAPSKLIDNSGVYSNVGVQVDGALWTDLC
jgi:lysophospholipase L1-like esterase